MDDKSSGPMVKQPLELPKDVEMVSLDDGQNHNQWVDNIYARQALLRQEKAEVGINNFR